MGFSCGLVGLPNAGKTTVFRALTGAPAEVGDYPFTTIAPQRGVAVVADDRVALVGKVMGSARLTPATVEVVDVAGLVPGASRGEGLGNQFLAHIREVDALFHVVRCFPDSRVTHVAGSTDPRRDAELVDAELLLADLETCARRRARLESLLKSGEEKWKQEARSLELLESHLGRGQPARILQDAKARVLAEEMHLLTCKPALYVANTGEEAAAEINEELERYATGQGAAVEAFSARMEFELGELDPEDRRVMSEALGWLPGGSQRLIAAGYRLLRLITYFTANQNECRGRAITAGTTAVEAAGKVHSDMGTGFIRAEVIPWAELVRAGSYPRARELGLLRTEGRDYVVQDGDVMLFRFTR